MEKQGYEVARWGLASVILFVTVVGVAQQVETGGAPEEGLAPAPVASFEYYPAQYTNQGREAEAHIQAF